MKCKILFLLFFIKVIVHGQSQSLVNKLEKIEPSNALSSSYTSSNICFSPPTSYSVYSPSYMTSGDFNKDGNKDIVVSAAGISILLGTGTGSFSPAVTYTSATGTGGRIIAADFNNDTNLDVGITAGCCLVIFLGNGLGSFSMPVSYGTAGSAFDLATADFNGDGNLDIVVTTNGSSGGYDIFLGNGLGGMTPLLTYIISAFQLGVGCYDFDADGKIDLAMVSGNKILVFNGNGNGTFSGAPVNYGTMVSDIEFTINDFTNDSFVDIGAASGSLSGYVDMYWGSSTGIFSPSIGANLCGSKNESICSTDFNGDGNIDIACGRRGNPGQVSILRGLGNSLFMYPFQTYTIGDVTNDIIADDFNNDGKQDIATLNPYLYSISVMLNATPHLSVTSGSSICAGSSQTLTVAGATSYTWSTGANTSSIIVTPSVNTTFSVIGTIGSCTNNAASSVSVQICTGINEAKNINDGIFLFPIPFTDYFEVSLSERSSEILSCEVYDFLMKSIFIYEPNTNKIRIDMKDNKSGIYFIRIKTNDEYSKFVKIIKQD